MFTFTESQLMGWLTPLLWPMLRTLALLGSLPVFNQRSVPMRAKVGLALFVAIAAQPALPAFAPIALDGPAAALVTAQQVLVGVTMGFAVRIVFAAIEFGGELMGLQMGLNFAGFFDPVTASQGTAAGRFFSILVGFVFVIVNGHLAVIAAVVRSFEVFPVSSEPLAFLRTIAPHTWGSEIFALGLWLALPLVGMLLFVNVVLGLVSRVAPQVNVFAVGFPITLGVGMVGLLMTLPLMQAPLTDALARLLAHFG